MDRVLVTEVPVFFAAAKQDEPAEDSCRGGPTPLIHNALMQLPLHGELVYREIPTDLEKAIQDHSAAIFQKIKQDAQAYNFSDVIPTAHNTQAVNRKPLKPLF